MKPDKLSVPIKPNEFRHGSPIPEPATAGTPINYYQKCVDVCLERGWQATLTALTEEGRVDDGTDWRALYVRFTEAVDPLPSGAAPTPDPFSKGYKNRHGDPVSDACGDEKHGECTQDLAKCHCHVRNGHKTMHAYMSPGQHLGAAPGTREETPHNHRDPDDRYTGCPGCEARVAAIANYDVRPFHAMPGAHASRVEEWLRSHCKSTADLRWSLYPIGMVQRYIERSESAGTVHLSEAQAQDAALTVFFREGKCILHHIECCLDCMKAGAVARAYVSEAQVEVEAQWLELAKILRLEKGDDGDWWIPADPNPRGPYSSILEAAIGLMLFNDELVKSDTAEVERLKQAANLLIDYCVAHDWGLMPEPFDSINPLLKLLDRETRRWERLESCSECDGDGCAKCNNNEAKK